MKIVVRGFAVLGLVGAALFGLLLFAIRTQNHTMLRGVRTVNKHVWNRQAIRTAGEPGSGYSKVVHRGRVSNTDYETPIDAIPTDEGFVVVLPYGARADWVRNVIHHGAGTIIHDGHRTDVHQPVLMHPRDIDHWFDPSRRRANKVFGIEQVLVVRRR